MFKYGKTVGLDGFYGMQTKPQKMIFFLKKLTVSDSGYLNLGGKNTNNFSPP